MRLLCGPFRAKTPVISDIGVPVRCMNRRSRSRVIVRVAVSSIL